MAVVRCAQGHFYDDTKFEACPHCAGNLPPAKPGLSDQATRAMVSDASVAARALAQKRLVEFAAGPRPADEKTVGVFAAEKGCDPVVGWLVCTAGPERGRDYRLHAGRNFIGRSLQMDISLVDDPAISRENHCAIVFDPRGLTFLLTPGESVAVNGEPVTDNIALLGDETIVIGASTFEFVRYCKEGRTW